MSITTTIRISKELHAKLESFKLHKNESFNDSILRVVSFAEKRGFYIIPVLKLGESKENTQ